MGKSKVVCCLAAVGSAAAALAVHGQTSPRAVEALELTLPPALYAVPGVTVGFHHRNLVLPLDIDGLRFEVACRVGKAEPQRWTVTARDADVGKHPLAVTVKDAKGSVLAKASTTLWVVPRRTGAGRSLRLLIVGDSLTGTGGGYPAVLAQRLAEPGNPAWSMLGTRSSPELKGVLTEGYPGWKWEDFLTRYEADPDPANKKFTSPFVFPDAQGTPALDVARYIRDSCGGRAPDVVTFLLGINDASRLYGSSEAGQNREALDQGIDGILEHAETLLKAFHAAAPQAALAVGIIPAANRREGAYVANFQGTRTAEGWKRIQHRVAQRMIERFKDREAESLFLVPTELFLDPDAGFPDNNAVHPNVTGHEQLGATFYGWLKWRLAQKGNP